MPSAFPVVMLGAHDDDGQTTRCVGGTRPGPVVPPAVHQAPRGPSDQQASHCLSRGRHPDPRPRFRAGPHRSGRSAKAPIPPLRSSEPAPGLRAPAGAQRRTDAVRRAPTQLSPRRLICDLFLFDIETLRALRAHIAVRTPLAELLARLGKRQGWDSRFGEWTAYAIFCLDVIEADIRVTPSTPAFFGQIHSRRDMERTDRYASHIVHFATEPGSTETVLADLVRDGGYPQGSTGQAAIGEALRDSLVRRHRGDEPDKFVLGAKPRYLRDVTVAP